MSFASALRPPLSPPLVKPGAVAQRTSLAKVMASLFRSNEQGAWYDPSDFERYISPKGPELWNDASAVLVNGAVRNAANDYTLDNPTDTASAGVRIDNTLTVGKTYEVIVTVVSLSGGSIGVASGANNSNTSATGAFLSRITAGSANLIVTCNGSAVAARVSGVSVRELTNISTASLFQDAAGTTPVTAMEQPVGLMLDKRLGLVRGPELFADASVVFGGASSRVSAGVYRLYTPDGTFSAFENAGKLTVGKTYEATFNIDSVTVAGGGVTVNSSAFLGAVNSTVGPKRIIFVADNTSAGLKRNGGAMDVQISNVSFREIPGNHASQTTTTARPLLSARKNLLIKTDQLTDGAWSKSFITTAASGTRPGMFDLFETAVNNNHYSQCGAGVAVANTDYTFSIDVVAGLRPWAQLRFSNANGGCIANFNVIDGTTQTQSTYGTGWTVTSKSIQPVALGVYRCTIVARTVDAIAFGAAVFGHNGTSDNFAGNTTAPMLTVGNPQAEFGSIATRYQRVNTATDYDWVGFPIYLRGDGVDDNLVIPFSAGWTAATIIAAATNEAATFSYAIGNATLATNQGVGLAFNGNGLAGIQGVSGTGTAFNTKQVEGDVRTASVGTAILNGTSVQARRNLGAYASTASTTSFGTGTWRVLATGTAAAGFLNGRFYGGTVVNRVLSPAECDQTVRVLASKAGAVL